MPIRHHAQRQHVVDSLDILLYQLHVLSYFMAPSLLSLVVRTSIQFQISRPRTIHPQRSMRFWYILILFINMGSIWTHTTVGVPRGRTVVLDFIGISSEPSKTQLLLLDFTITALSLVIATISFETSYTAASTASDVDTLAPIPQPDAYEEIPPPTRAVDPLILDLRFSHFIKHICSPPPPPLSSSDSNEPLLPLPNTASARAFALRALIAARRGRAPSNRQVRDTATEGQEGEEGRARRVPGAIDDPD